MSEYIHKSHNVSVLLYHFVCPAKYRRFVFSSALDKTLKDICLEIAKRYDISFIEIGTDQDHVHFLIQSVPTESPTKIIRTVKSITAKEIFKFHPEVKQKLWGGEFWSKGYYVNTVGRHVDENTIQIYVKSQGKEKEYKKLHSQQLSLF
ncbi:IS200/IS605 family transposase [Flavobacterium sp. LM4]|uniref:IS200/IS605 family transposase n=1 Tax=Flavobacterium sp. LM4 TaxID=1938609 RepID=UPI0009940AA8|nr:IS200/IS605 family transposase [Flavobacterium sp. LM4]OOV12635.1 IS200/IS605 family transposase [Flavobacterium sp. LM4]